MRLLLETIISIFLFTSFGLAKNVTDETTEEVSKRTPGDSDTENPIKNKRLRMRAELERIAPTKRLNDGNHIPMLGMGTYGFEDFEDILQVIWNAVQAGYSYIDIDADILAAEGNDDKIAIGIANVMDKQLVKREDLYISLTLKNDVYSRYEVVQTLTDTLAKINLEYIDLYLLKTYETKLIDFSEIWRGMEEAKSLGLTRSIGVANFTIEQIDGIINNSKIVPAVNQIEIHPSNTREKEVEECLNRNITVIAHSPLGFFFAKNGDRMIFYKDHQKRGAFYRSGDTEASPKIKAIAKKYKKTIHQVILRYSVQRNFIPIPNSTYIKNMRENIRIFDFELNSDDMAAIRTLNENKSLFG